MHGILTRPQARLYVYVLQIHSRSNRASTASVTYSNGTKVIYFNRYVQRTVRINEYNWPDKQFFKNYYYILKVRSGESDGAPASRSGIHSGANDGTLCGRRSVCPFNPFLELSLLSYVRVHRLATASRDHVYSQNANGARKQAGSVPVSYVPTVRLHAKNGQIFRGSAPSPATASSWWDVPAGDVRVPA